VPDETRSGREAQLCILVTSSPGSENSRSLVKISEAALKMGHAVRIFLMYDGVYHILQEDFMALGEKGAIIVLCAYNAEEKGLAKREGVLFGSQYDLSTMVSQSDAFLAFT
jgi:sulfur relay (sulfurtransferase) complex TusBCD TusD component (DsrE family)